MATKKKVKANANPRKTARARKQGAYEYTVKVSAGRVVIEGTNDGNIYGKHKQPVTFTAATGVPRFTFAATDFVLNDSKNKKLARKWPFKGAEPEWPQHGFTAKLKSPGLSKKAIYKYTIAIEGTTPADPIIIIER